MLKFMEKSTNQPTNQKTTGVWLCAKYLPHKDEWGIVFSYKLQPLYSPSGRRQGHKKLQYDEKMMPAEVYSCMVVHAEKVREEVKEHLFHIYCKCPQRRVGPDETSGRCDGPRGMRQPRIFRGTECNTVFLEHRVKGWGKGSEEKREARLWGTRMPRKVLRLHSPCP